jgi:hypothetical protein
MDMQSDPLVIQANDAGLEQNSLGKTVTALPDALEMPDVIPTIKAIFPVSSIAF